MVTIRPAPVTVGGVTLRNHLVLAAGRILVSGAGGVVTKSIGPAPNPGYPGPCCVRTGEGGLINAMGLPNPSQGFAAELPGLAGEPVVISIYGGSPEEFARVASWFEGRSAGFELNLSCPHAEGYGAALGSDPDMVEDCTRAVSALGLPTWVKLTPNVADITECGRAAERGGASALVAINTVKAMRISTDLRRPVLGNRFGGLSGRSIFPIAVRCVYEVYEASRLPVIGCGGISTADDVIEMMMAGASAVEIGTAVMDDPGIFTRIAAALYSGDGAEPAGIVGCAHV
jgi:dihydroorotate dehydrogenase (NAD+) catalytic subunit